MTWVKRIIVVLIIPVFFLLSSPKQVYAYVDPGTGGMIVQGLVGLLVGSLAVAGIFWKRITGSVKKMFKRSGKGENEDDAAGALTAGTKNKAR